KGEEVKEDGRAPVRVYVSVDKPIIRVGDLIRYTISVDSETGAVVRMPAFAEHLGGFAISDWLRSEAVVKGSRRLQSHTYVMETYLTGTYEIPPARIEYELNGTTNSVESTAICVEVRSVAEEGDVFSGIRDIKGPVSVMGREARRWRALALAAVMALVCGVLIVQFVRHVRRRPKRVEPPPPAHVVAYARLRGLRAKGLVEAGEMKEYYYELSLIVRHYIEDRFGLRAPEQTTEEFLGSLRSGSVLSEAHRRLLEEFLTESDLVKFANYAVREEDAERAHDRAVAFIEETREREEAVGGK
ncbi:MAG: BatD family protein, partial [bacterium]|nr:BatD family protein [bacterium]